MQTIFHDTQTSETEREIRKNKPKCLGQLRGPGTSTFPKDE